MNANVFDFEKKFVDFTGLDYFWEKAKAYVDAADKVTADKVAALETTVSDENTGLVKKYEDLKATVDALGDIEGGDGLAGMIEAKINTLNVSDTAVEGQYVSSVSETAGKITVNRLPLPNYTEVYDAKGAAATAEQNAKKYTDDAVGTWTVDETPGTGLRKEIEEKVAAVAADAKSYSMVAVTGEELATLGTNVKEAYKLVDEDNTQAGDVIKIYKDSALQSVVLDGQELVFTYLLTTGAENEVRVDVSNFLAESEFKDGLQVVDHVVSVKVDGASDSFLTVSEAGVKLSGVQDAINTKADKSVVDELVTTVGKEAEGDNPATGLIKDVADLKAADATTLASAKEYTDNLFNNIKFASTEEIDAIFAPEE